MKVSVGVGQGAPSVGAGNLQIAGVQAVGSAVAEAGAEIASARSALPVGMGRLMYRASSSVSAVMCLSILCLGAGLAEAAREPDDVLQEQGIIEQQARIPISAFADMAQEEDALDGEDVAQGESADAVVPPVKRKRPAEPSLEQPSAPAAAQEASPAEASQKETAQPAPSPAAGPAITQDAQQAQGKKPPEPEGKTAKPSEEAESTADRSGPIFPEAGGIFAPITDWLARANREYQGTVVKELSRPSQEGEAASEQAAKDDAKAKEAEAAREREAAAKAEQKAKGEREAKAAAEAAAAARAAAEAKAANAEAEKKAAEQNDAAAAAKARAAEEQQQAEAARRAEQARKEAEARKAQEDSEARKLREAARQADERSQQRAAEEQARKAQAQRQAEAERAAREARIADEQRRAEAQRNAQPSETADTATSAQGNRRLKHRRWAITITPEPIARPRPQTAEPRGEFRVSQAETESGVLIGTRRLAPHMGLGAGELRGAKVEGWSWRGGRCRFAGRRVRHLPGRYTVAKGDSLWRISEKHYDSGRYYKRIYRANRHKIADPDLIYPCQRFKVPRK
ncbi:MAG: LysM peptidoglycan-binding domain-containing protein [Hyphomicrobium sp.]